MTINVTVSLLISFLLLLVNICNGQVLKSSFGDKLEEILNKTGLVVSPQCRNHLLHYVYGLKAEESWALRMLDANAKAVPSGILEGNLFDLGSFEECLNIEEDKQGMEIFGKYCIGRTFIEIPVKQIRYNYETFDNSTSTLFPSAIKMKKINIFLAKCFPGAYSTTEMENLYQQVDYETNLSEDLCQTKATQPKLDNSDIAAICFFGIILSFVIISTAFDVTCYYLEIQLNNSVLILFSILKNFRKLIDTKSVPDEITCLDGVRVLTMMWILIAHRHLALTSYPTTNFFQFLDWLHELSSMYIDITIISLDTFFLISGLLVSYNHLIEMKRGVKFNIIFYYLKRYLRLTTLVAILIIIHVTFLRYAGSGPLWRINMESKMIDACRKAWWQALLHIQNINYTKSNLCIPPSWYLSVDMQLYILSPLLLLPLTKWPKFTLLVTTTLTVCSILGCAFIGWFYELSPALFENRSAEAIANYHLYYFSPTYARACPWLMGFILGYLIFRLKERNVKLFDNKIVIFVLWTLSLTTMFSIILGPHSLMLEKYNRLGNLLHIIFARPVWVLAVGWIIFACFNGYGGPVNWFLSLPLFRVLSKLTFTLFFSHWIIICISIYSMQTPIYFQTIQMYHQFWGDYAYSLAFALILLLTIEFPTINIIKLLKSK